MMNRIKESQVQKDITDFFDLKKIFYIRCNSGAVFIEDRRIKLCPPGTPDLFCLIDGKSIFIEVKRDLKEYQAWKNKYIKFVDTGYLNLYNSRSVQQHKTMKRIEEAGGICICTYSLDNLLEDFEELEIKI